MDLNRLPWDLAWKGALARCHLTVVGQRALAAGREHFRNYRDVLAHEGLPGWISSHGLSVQTEKVVSTGNMYAHVARK